MGSMCNNIQNHDFFFLTKWLSHTFQVLSTSGNMFVSDRPVPIRTFNINSGKKNTWLIPYKLWMDIKKKETKYMHLQL